MAGPEVRNVHPLGHLQHTIRLPIDWKVIARAARKNQPGIMLVARHTDSPYENYLTPEQTVPEKAIDQPWESCITMNEYSWSYRPEVPFKTTRDMLDILVKVVSRGGNLLLNVGPKPDGILQEDKVYFTGKVSWKKIDGGIRVTIPKSFRKSPACDHIWTLKIKEE